MQAVTVGGGYLPFCHTWCHGGHPVTQAASAGGHDTAVKQVFEVHNTLVGRAPVGLVNQTKLLTNWLITKIGHVLAV
jgi:hypothetical protein